MPRPRTTNAGPVAGLLLMLAVLFVVAACGALGSALPSPSASPSMPAPTVPAGEAPSEAPASPDPSAAPGTPAGAIRLDVADPHDVLVAVVDPEGSLTGASSGRAGDGMSVRWGDVEVVNVDEDSLRVTWVGLPVDAAVSVKLDADGEGYVLGITQPAPPASSDATGFDRVLVLDFGSAVKAENVKAVFTAA